MGTIKMIVECSYDNERERLISEIGKVVYHLPMIDSYAVEIDEDNLTRLNGIAGVKAVYQNSLITAQMDNSRRSVKADEVHNSGFNGKGIGIAVLDTGVAPMDDFIKPNNRLIVFKDFVNGKKEPYDDNGHGTHVAGIAAGNGYKSQGKFMGIAPESNIIALKILDESGRGNTADVLAGLQWVLDNHETYNIRIVNLSIGGTAELSINMKTDPLIRAVEEIWNKGIVMTTAAGNNGPKPGSITSPGISRKVITVGASDDEHIKW